MTACKQPPAGEAMVSTGRWALFEHSDSIQGQEGGPGLPPLGLIRAKVLVGVQTWTAVPGRGSVHSCLLTMIIKILDYFVPYSAACVVHRSGHMGWASDVSIAVLGSAKPIYTLTPECS